MTNRTMPQISLLIILLFFWPFHSLGADRETYSIAPGKSVFAAITDTAGLFSGFAHSHRIETPGVKNGLKGQIVFKNGVAQSIEVLVASKELFLVDNRHDRNNFEKITNSFKSKDVLDIENFPWIKFNSTNISVENENYQIVGNFNLRGITKSITVPATLTFTHDRRILRVSTQFEILQTDFGIKPFSTGLGTIRVANKVIIEINLVAFRE